MSFKNQNSPSKEIATLTCIDVNPGGVNAECSEETLLERPILFGQGKV